MPIYARKENNKTELHTKGPEDEKENLQHRYFGTERIDGASHSRPLLLWHCRCNEACLVVEAELEFGLAPGHA